MATYKNQIEPSRCFYWAIYMAHDGCICIYNTPESTCRMVGDGIGFGDTCMTMRTIARITKCYCDTHEEIVILQHGDNRITLKRVNRP